MALSSVGSGSLMGVEGKDMPLSTTKKPNSPWQLNSTQSPQTEQVSVSQWQVFTCHRLSGNMLAHMYNTHRTFQAQAKFLTKKDYKRSLFCRCLFFRWRRSSAWSSHIRTFVTLWNRYAANAKGMFFLPLPTLFIHFSTYYKVFQIFKIKLYLCRLYNVIIIIIHF